MRISYSHVPVFLLLLGIAFLFFIFNRNFPFTIPLKTAKSCI